MRTLISASLVRIDRMKDIAGLVSVQRRCLEVSDTHQWPRIANWVVTLHQKKYVLGDVVEDHSAGVSRT
jgi:hypothetical protein